MPKVLESPPQPLAKKVTGNEITLSEAAASVVEKVMENDFDPAAGISLPEPPDWNATVPAHDADQPAGGVTLEHVQLPPEAGVAMSISCTPHPLPLYAVQVKVLFIEPLDTAEGATVTE